MNQEQEKFANKNLATNQMIYILKLEFYVLFGLMVLDIKQQYGDIGF